MGVCVSLCGIALLKAKNLFEVWVKFGVKSDILFKITCVSFTLIILQ